MPSTYTSLLRAELQASGENETTWGDKTNTNIEEVLEAAIAGMASIALLDANYTLTTNFAATDEARNAILKFTGTLTAGRNVICPASSKIYVVTNATTGGFAVTVKTSGGTGVAVLAGETAVLYCDGTNVVEVASRVKDGELVPAKMSTSNTAWRFDDSVGINRNQPVVSGYGALGLDGTSGSFVTLFANGTHIGALLATPTGLVIESTGNPVSIEIDGEEVLYANADGDVAVQRNLAAVNVNATGAVTATSFTSTGGYTGVTYANVTGALGFTPVMQGAVTGQLPGYAISIGFGAQGGAPRLNGNGTDYGEIITSGNTGELMKITGTARSHHVASHTANPDAQYAGIVVREAGYASDMGGDTAYAPRLALYWNGITAAQLALDATGRINFVGLTGASYASTVTYHGFFIDTITTGASDPRLKNIEGPIDSALAKLCKFDTFYYTHNETAVELGLPADVRKMGVSAAQTKRYFPELVRRAPCDTIIGKRSKKEKSKTGKNYMTVDYEGFVPALIAAVKELKQQNDALHKRIAKLEKKQ